MGRDRNLYLSTVASLKRKFVAKFRANANGEADDMVLGDFVITKTLGEGSFGKVKLASYKPSSELFALKIINKQDVEDEESQKRLESEIRIMKSIDHPFIARMTHHFEDNRHVYMQLEYCPGGDLYALFDRHGKLTEDQGRFYGAQIVLALDFLHALGIVHRDIKPNNILIGSDGYIRLADFGFAKKIRNRTSSVCGCPGYMAPEMLATIENTNSSYNQSVDWWSLGVLLYSLIIGISPFESYRFEYSAFMTSIDVPYPKGLDADFENLLRKLMMHDVKGRLGCGKRGSKEVMDHPWFSSIDFKELFFKKLKPPSKPVPFKFDCHYNPYNPIKF